MTPEQLNERMKQAVESSYRYWFGQSIKEDDDLKRAYASGQCDALENMATLLLVDIDSIKAEYKGK